MPNLDKYDLIDLGGDVDPKVLGRMLALALRKPDPIVPMWHIHVAYRTQIALAMNAASQNVE